MPIIISDVGSSLRFQLACIKKLHLNADKQRSKAMCMMCFNINFYAFTILNSYEKVFLYYSIHIEKLRLYPH